jgi:hypothetical protein
VRIPDDPKEQQTWMLELLVKTYGIPVHVIDPDTQVLPGELAQPDKPSKKSRKPEAEILKSNQRLYELIACLQEQHGLFLSGTLGTDCPIHPWFGKTDPEGLRVYRGVFRIIPRDHGYIAFTCLPDSECDWTLCPIHPTVPFVHQRFDPFDLLQVLDSIRHGYRYPVRHGNVADYAQELSKALGVDTKRLRANKAEKGGLGRYRGMRYPANRNQLLIEIMSTVPTNDQDLNAFLDRIWRLIWFGKQPEPYFDRTQSPNTVWFPDSSAGTFKKSGTACRLWLYLWIQQQQQRARIVADLNELAQVLGVTPDQTRRYARLLEAQGKLTREGKSALKGKVETWTVKA